MPFVSLPSITVGRSAGKDERKRGAEYLERLRMAGMVYGVVDGGGRAEQCSEEQGRGRLVRPRHHPSSGRSTIPQSR